MALKINTSNYPYTEQRVTLGRNVVTLVFKYNIVDESWYMDIFTSEGQTPIKTGIKIMPNQNLTGRYILDNLKGGNIWCLRQKRDFTPVTRDNFGGDRTYQLYWLSSDEEEEIGVDDVIQL